VPGGAPGLQNQLVGRRSRPWWVRFSHTPAMLIRLPKFRKPYWLLV